jgi:hypothetical protein
MKHYIDYTAHMKSGSIFLIILLVVVIAISLLFPALGGLEAFSGMSSSYSTVGSGEAVDNDVPYLINPSSASCTSIGGLGGLFCSYGATQTNDPLANPTGSMNCRGTGLTTNGGNVCMSDSTFQLLTTRGGNT